MVRVAQDKSNAISYDRIPFASNFIFQELSEHHLGSGWYEDMEGHKFRSGISYPNGSKIRYSSDLKERNLGRTQIQDWGIQSKLERIGSKLVPFLNEVMDNDIYFQKVVVESADTGEDL